METLNQSTSSGDNQGHHSPLEKLLAGISESFALLYLTATCYLCAYAFKAGFFDYYFIPRHLISVDLDDCLQAAFYLITALISSATTANAIVIFIRRAKRDQSTRLQILWLCLAGFCVAGIVENIAAFGWPTWVFAGIVTLFAIIIVCGSKTDKSKPPEVGNPDPQDLLDHLRVFFGSRNLFLVGFGLSVFYISMFSGRRVAKQQQNFEKLEDSWSILITTYSDGYITKDYEPRTNMFLPTLTLIPFEEAKKMKLKTVRLEKPMLNSPELAKPDEVPVAQVPTPPCNTLKPEESGEITAPKNEPTPSESTADEAKSSKNR